MTMPTLTQPVQTTATNAQMSWQTDPLPTTAIPQRPIQMQATPVTNQTANPISTSATINNTTVNWTARILTWLTVALSITQALARSDIFPPESNSARWIHGLDVALTGAMLGLIGPAFTKERLIGNNS